MNIVEELEANRREPHGPVRNARAEYLVELAEDAPDPLLYGQALRELVNAYEYSGESHRVAVPFARWLQLWDSAPQRLSERNRHSLFWCFKWVTSSLRTHPDVPLAGIRGWLDEMERRYAAAGYGMQPVHAQRHFVAAHVGDVAEAERQFALWRAAERSEMSDCHACDESNQGRWQASRGQDAAALDTWTPVLENRLYCTEEPHRTLAVALAPLLRLGEHGVARAYHLRGYRMVKGDPNLRTSVGQHLEFAALTGNGARGLESLAEHSAWLAAGTEAPQARLGFLTGAAVLLQALVAQGHGDLPAPGQESTVAALQDAVCAEALALAARFDARNGTTAESERLHARLDVEPQWIVPLGGRAAPPASQPQARVPGTTVTDLIARAEELDRTRRPDAGRAWLAVGAAGAELAPNVAARVADARVSDALANGTGEPVHLAEVAEAYRRAGDDAQAILTELRAWRWAYEDSGEADASAVTAMVARVGDLHAAGRAEPRQLLRALEHSAAAHCVLQLRDAVPPATTAAALDRLREAAVGDDQYLADADALAASVAGATATSAEERTAADRLAASAAERFVAQGRPWAAAEPLRLRAQVALDGGDLDAGERYLRGALANGVPYLAAGEEGVCRFLLAQVLRHRDECDAAVDEALRAATLLSADAARAAQARVVAAQAFALSERPAEAAALYEASIDTLRADTEPDELARLLAQLGGCLERTGEYRAAAERLLEAAQLAGDSSDRQLVTELAHAAGGALERCGQPAEAMLAYERAAHGWAALERPEPLARALRATAWLLADDDYPAARARFGEAAAALAAGPHASWERHETDRQLADFLEDVVRAGEAEDEMAMAGESLAAAERAAAGFAELGDRQAQCGAEAIAARLELNHLGQPEAARRRVTALRALADEHGLARVVAWCESFLE